MSQTKKESVSKKRKQFTESFSRAMNVSGFCNSELADKFCVSPATISQWKTGRTLPGVVNMPEVQSFIVETLKPVPSVSRSEGFYRCAYLVGKDKKEIRTILNSDTAETNVRGRLRSAVKVSNSFAFDEYFEIIAMEFEERK